MSFSGKIILLTSIVVAVIAMVNITSAYRSLHILDGDSIAFYPPMVKFANTGEFIHPFWGSEFDNKGTNRYLYHGFMYPLLVASIAWKGEYYVMRTISSILGIFTLIITAFSLHLISLKMDAHKRNLIEPILIILAILGCNSYLESFQGRPETLASLIAAAGFLALIYFRREWHWIICAVTIAFLGVTSPISASLVFLIVCAYSFYLWSLGESFLFLTRVSLVTGIISSLLLVVFPYSLNDYVTGLIRHGTLAAIKGYWDASVVYYWVLSPNKTFIGLVYLWGFLILVYQVFVKNKLSDCACKKAFLTSCFLALMIAYYFGVRVSARNYNIIFLVPIIMWVIVYFAMDQLNRSKSEFRTSVITITILILCLSTISTMRRFVIDYYSYTYGTSYANAALKLGDILAESDKKIEISNGLYSLTKNYEKIKFFELNRIKPDADILVIQQANRKTIVPKDIEGYRIIYDGFNRTVPRLFGIKVANTVGDYSFAVYKKR